PGHELPHLLGDPALDHVVRGRARPERRLALAVPDQLKEPPEPATVDVADARMALLEPGQLALQDRAHPPGVVDQPLGPDRLEHGQAGREAERLAAAREAEADRVLLEEVGDLLRD